jgi:hypothetical protein
MKKETLLNREEAAKYLGVAVRTLYVWAVEKPTRIPYRKLSKRTYYLKEDLDKYIESRTFR